MPLQSSGAISFDNLQTEFGNTNPIPLSDYYRGGGLVPNITENNNVPTSGAISLFNFYSASNTASTDVTVDTFNINNMSVSGNDYVEVDSNTITIAGINTSITLNIGTTTARAQASGVEPSVTLTLEVYRNGTSVNSVSWFRSGPGSTGNQTRNMTVTVSNGDTLKFKFIVDVTASGSAGDGGGTVSAVPWDITNVTDSNAFIDTFTTSGSATRT